jgi:hypothetical protein
VRIAANQAFAVDAFRRKVEMIAGGRLASAVLMWIEPLLSGRSWCAITVMPPPWRS